MLTIAPINVAISSTSNKALTPQEKTMIGSPLDVLTDEPQ